ncbi:CHAT domain-containing protein [Pedobacter sp. BS3]|uniref:CHAT domain-containing protein n=1 Tax=Pedobacter sp. BS3 TaxID=2567937 RepID=UPI0011F03476|nr:CHAT domain-containing tetratricopeptide repeat protein [Pedobacter sp. BS3]TZF81529.1 CHAT domain-containing protein [Pedobacter sp. BS3]
MNSRKYVHHFIVLVLVCCPALAFAIPGNVVQNRLDSLRKADNLSEWIYSRIDYSHTNPDKRLAVLMQTGTGIWRKPATAAEHEAFLNLLINQGYYQLYDGNVLRSIDCYEQAYAYFQKHPSNQIDIAEYLLKPLGNNYTRLGDYSRALFIQDKNLAMAFARKDSVLIASVYSNMAISYKSTGNLAMALNCCKKGFLYLKKDVSEKGLLYNTLADVWYDDSDYQQATIAVEQALAILTKTNVSANTAYWLLSAYTLAGNLARKHNQPGVARSYYNQGLNVINRYFKGSRRREMAGLMIQTANTWLDDKHPEKALDDANKALDVLLPTYKFTRTTLPDKQVLYGENRLYDAFIVRARCLLALGNDRAALDNILLALETGERSRNEYATVSDKLHYQGDAKHVAGMAMDIAYRIWQKSHDAVYAQILLDIAERTKARVLSEQVNRNRQHASLAQTDTLFKRRVALERAIVYYEREALVNHRDKQKLQQNKQEAQYELASVNKQIRLKYPASAFAQHTVLTGNALLQRIPAGYRLIEYFADTSAVYIIAAEKGKVLDIRRINNATTELAAVKDYLQIWYHQGAAAMMNNPQAFYEQSFAIYRKYLTGLTGTEHEKVLIVADDVLGLVPFDALVTRPDYVADIRKWPFLLHRTDIQYSYSLNTWLNEAPRKQSGQTTFAGFFITQTPNTAVTIPAVAAEAKAISGKFRGSFYTDRKATLETFKAVLPQTDILHISTHSYPFKNEPVLQFIDKRFFLFELTAQQQVPSLVVLSSCRTADGEVAKGEGVLSLSYGFIAAGTRGVLAGLWNVNDKAASGLVTAFYEHLQKGESTANALRQAKLQWLGTKHANTAMLLPYYWADLVYIGKPQTLKPEPALTHWYWYVGAVLFLLVMGIVFWRSGKYKKYWI